MKGSEWNEDFYIFEKFARIATFAVQFFVNRIHSRI